MLILGIESSCDETSVALVKDGKKVLANLVSSQIEIHRKYGGVVPEVASRQHLKTINPLLAQALKQSEKKKEEIDAIAVTFAPGLQGSLMIGLMVAKTLAWLWKKPLIGVNHLEGHMYAAFIENEIEPPAMVLLVSGGHTENILFSGYGKYKLCGKTKDDAVGEAFDKVARLLGLPYPGAPYIDQAAQKGNPEKFHFTEAIPDSNDFSFSGIKTAVLYKINELKKNQDFLPINDLAASFSKSVADTLVKKTLKAAKKNEVNKIIITGGVAANSQLRKKMADECKKEDFSLFLPTMKYCTDNAAMIAAAAYYKFISGSTAMDGMNLKAVSRLPVTG